MKHRIRTTTALTFATALLGGASAAASPTSTPDACEGVSGCTVVSTADIDGDGAADSVGLKLWGTTDEGQKITTRVATADGEALKTFTDTSRTISTVDDHFRGAAAIDGEDGDELVLMTDLGAHTAYYQVLTYRDGALTELKDPRDRSRWMTDGSISTDFSYQRTVTADGRPKLVSREAIDEDQDGDFTLKTYSNGWKDGDWVRFSATTRTDVSPSVAHRYDGWVVPGMAEGL